MQGRDFSAAYQQAAQDPFAHDAYVDTTPPPSGALAGSFPASDAMNPAAFSHQPSTQYAPVPLTQDPEMVDLSTRPLSAYGAQWRPGQDGPSARNSAGGSAFGNETEFWAEEEEQPWWKSRWAIIAGACVVIAALAVALGVGLGVGLNSKKGTPQSDAARLSSLASVSSASVARTSLSTQLFTSTSYINGQPVVVTSTSVRSNSQAPTTSAVTSAATTSSTGVVAPTTSTSSNPGASSTESSQQATTTTPTSTYSSTINPTTTTSLPTDSSTESSFVPTSNPVTTTSNLPTTSNPVQETTSNQPTTTASSPLLPTSSSIPETTASSNSPPPSSTESDPATSTNAASSNPTTAVVPPSSDPTTSAATATSNPTTGPTSTNGGAASSDNTVATGGAVGETSIDSNGGTFVMTTAPITNPQGEIIGTLTGFKTVTVATR